MYKTLLLVCLLKIIWWVIIVTFGVDCQGSMYRSWRHWRDTTLSNTDNANNNIFDINARML